MRDTDVLILKHLSNFQFASFQKRKHTDNMAAEEEEEEELLDYEEEDVAKTTTLTASKDGEKKGEKNKKKGYVGMHSTGFRDFLLKPELLRAIVDCGFEHPSEGNYT